MEDSRRTRRGAPLQGASGEGIHQESVRHLRERANHHRGEVSTDDSIYFDVRVHRVARAIPERTAVADIEDEREGRHCTHARQDSWPVVPYAAMVEAAMSDVDDAGERNLLSNVELTHTWCDGERSTVVWTRNDGVRVFPRRGSVPGPVPRHLGGSDADGEEAHSSHDPVAASGRALSEGKTGGE